ncbi:ankyrin repeat domain-containing protein [Candidatus Babeliales bacterium]|nr:ankyrin repeat domain-containing protein [Candidatus Babeliales bacterium]
MMHAIQYFLLGAFCFPHICFAASESNISEERFIQFCTENSTEKIKAIILHAKNKTFLSASEKEYGYTPLHYAVMHKNESLVLLFLEQKANPDACDNIEQTPLHLAAEQGSINITKMLLENHSNRFLKDEQGNTALALAMKNKQWSISRLLATSFPLGQEVIDPLYDTIFPS